MSVKLLPLVGLPADTYEEMGFRFHAIGEKYLAAVAEVAGCVPVMIPAMSDTVDIEHLLPHLDGVVMTGAISNVHPPLYGEEPTADHEPFDPLRDALTLELIRRCLTQAIPLFGICRGFQEINVALGGTLETELQRGEGRLDHRARPGEALEVRYGPAHPVRLTPGGKFAALLGEEEIIVNSVHRQGVRTLAPSLVVEATAPDGIIEAVSVRDAPGFALATQWHPEFMASDNPHSRKLFEAFGAAARARRAARSHTG